MHCVTCLCLRFLVPRVSTLPAVVSVSSNFLCDSVYGGWTTLTEVRKWAAVDDALWAQFAHQLGDEKFDNVSLMTALQPSDIKDAVEATQGTPITRTKLRLVYAVVRVMFELDRVDVGAPPVPSQPAVENSKGVSVRWWAQHEGQSVFHPRPVFGS